MGALSFIIGVSTAEWMMIEGFCAGMQSDAEVQEWKRKAWDFQLEEWRQRVGEISEEEIMQTIKQQHIFSKQVRMDQPKRDAKKNAGGAKARAEQWDESADAAQDPEDT